MKLVDRQRIASTSVMLDTKAACRISRFKPSMLILFGLRNSKVG